MSAVAFNASQERFSRSGLHRVNPASHGVPVEFRIPVSPPPRPRGGRTWRLITGSLAVAAGAFVAGRQPWKQIPASAVAESAAPVQAVRTVTVASPTPAASSTVVLPATIRPWQVATLYARVSGYLSTWRPDLGDTVHAGDLLAEIATPEIDQSLAEGEAQYREAVAAAVQARAEREEAQADLRVAEAQLNRVRAETELARSQLTRREKLLANRAVSQEELETSQRQLEAREADIAANVADVARRRTNLATRAAIIDAREATVKSRGANVDRLRELQGFQHIVAPFDGVITRRTAEVGMLVEAGKEPLFVVEDSSRVRVQLNVPQTYSLQMRSGTPADISLPESSGSKVAATVTRIADSVDVASRTMLVEIELDNSTHRFQPGSFAHVSLASAQTGAGWTIPTNTLAMRVAGPQVAVVDSQNRIALRPVHLGRDLGNRIVVTEGIRGDERLVVNPGDDLVEGTQVQIGERTELRSVVRK